MLCWRVISTDFSSQGNLGLAHMWMEKINSVILLLFLISFCYTDSASLGCSFHTRQLCIKYVQLVHC